MIPQQPRHFVDRDEAQQLHQAVGQSRIVVVVTGLRGIGKTQLAAELARHQVIDGDGLVAWINAETIDNSRTALADIAIRLRIVGPEEDSNIAAYRLRDHLSSRHEPALLVFDNATDPDRLRDFLPTGDGSRVVITTTDHAFTYLGETIDLAGYTPSEAVHYLCQATNLTDRIAASQLADTLGHHPLALAAAAATITGLRLNFTQYQRLLDTQALPEALVRRPGQDYPRSADQAILLALKTTEAASVDLSLDTATCELIELMSMLSAAGVNRRILPTLAGQLDKAIERCVTGSIMNWSDTGDTILMHRLTARVIRERAQTNNTTRQLIFNALALVAEQIPKIEDAWANRELVFHLVDQIDAIWNTNIAERAGTDETVLALTARRWAVTQLHELADLPRAIDRAENTLTDRERILGPIHPSTLTSRDDLAAAYESAGQPDKAITLYKATLTDRERILGADHPDTLTSRNNLAYAYMSAGLINKAIALYETTLADTERILGADHPDTLTNRNNLAGAYESAGQLAKAITIYETTVADAERILGADNPSTLTYRNNLAGAVKSAGQLDKAIALYETTLADYERLFGADHPRSLGGRNNLASTYRSAGQLDKAIALLEATLADYGRLFGADHPSTLTCRNNLAGAYESAGQLAKAIALYETTLTDTERILGADHPDTLASRNNLADVYRSAGQLDQAIALLKATLTDTERILGADHPLTLIGRNNLAGAYRSAGQLDQAIALLKATLTDTERILGADHPLT
ncbi:tetratricopeptide repeat protein, partial [Nocardia sp. NPDC059240]|uniref:tetratricopeptide repeat protein n=1 Tax=Nocardia sp. NPDC059240 TaxID=3346786 RepID=UPI0036A6829F